MLEHTGEPLPSIRGACVVVVDDHPDTLELFRAVLELGGAVPRPFASPAEAEASIRHDPPDVLVSDLLSGDGAATLIRTAKAFGIPAVVVTGHARPADLDRALAAGFDEHLVKPVDPADLCRVVAKLLARVRPSG